MVISLVAVIVFALVTGVMLSLVEPIFNEVLLTDKMPIGLGGLGGGGEEDVEKAAPGFLKHLDLDAKLKAGYQWLKAYWDVGDEEVVFFVPLLFVLVYGVRSVAAFFSGYSFQRIGLGVTTDIRNALYKRILDQSSRFHQRHPSGELVSRMVNDLNMMQVAVSTRLLDLVQQPLALLVLLTMLISMNAKLTFFTLVLTPVILYPVVRFGKGIRGTSHQSQERMAELTRLLTEGIRGHRVAKAFGMEAFEQDRFEAATGRHLKVNLRAQILSNLSSPVIETLGALGGAALLIYAGRAIRAEQLNVGEFITFLTILLVMYDPVRRLNKANLILQESMAAAHRLADLIEEPNEITDRPNGTVVSHLEEGIHFEKIRFGYDDHETVLTDVDLKVARGEMVALVGPSGAGKSTLVNLLPRFFDPNQGRVTIDGVDVRDMPLQALRALIGLVTQDTVLFDDTVRNNIAYGRSDLSLEDVRSAAKAAYADDFILEMENGYDTVVGEGGVRLSGGQKQRLSIARALLKDAPILVLDEATSHLDSEAESLVQKAIQNLTRGRTTLVIAHRFSTVTTADRIIVLRDGRIEEQGTHQDLLERNGTYRRLYDLQFDV